MKAVEGVEVSVHLKNIQEVAVSANQHRDVDYHPGSIRIGGEEWLIKVIGG